LFKFSKLLQPAVIVIDNIDRIFPKFSPIEDDDIEVKSSSKSKAFQYFLNEIDSISNKDKIFILMTAKGVESINPEIVKPNRIDLQVTIPSPNLIQRIKLTKYFINEIKHNITDELLEILSEKMHGFLPSDILNACRNALLLLEDGKDSILTSRELDSSIQEIKPINLKGILLDVPKVFWKDIGGNKDLIRKIRQNVEWPLKNPESFKKIGITPPNVSNY